MSIKNRIMRFATDPAQAPAAETKTTTEAPADSVTFTKEQWEQLCELLKLEPATSIEDMMKFLEELINAATEAIKEKEDGQQVKASQATAPKQVLIDGEVWETMQDAVKTGLKAKTQEKRLAAEQVVDQAIRLGKASATDRERLIQAWHIDPDKTTHHLSNAQEIPRVEIGTSVDFSLNEHQSSGSWVR